MARPGELRAAPFIVTQRAHTSYIKGACMGDYIGEYYRAYAGSH